ncbi:MULTISPECIES: Cd(II)/Pb(II)-responsive transcriptional regulator [Burkholderiaceae]|uniref:Cd(II)/Pb(II)-responsive transcriptional regulator n=1 Tax=Burkholderiaceae TaxID=119060 RepID=UPI00095D0794|nr:MULTISPECIES: Cd(II)/Pb(II)-responsive transcriptional regulator [Burkholderiaceae]MCF2133749.1 Cd(II)/Pb(II)-responsive transcriptional regulator [Mycetohabitans sp. B3]MCG1018436.1 Cd(II)/Pb(II)-responsive transcriptional regulator [Mycetohabitans sp. B4]MCG1039302.1 Cd(II)/Pb(II)-responsive transcriptional regulator [Mycetohabitans sp. B7]SIT66231.1 Cd(II)/Pb(II)-responsive transcriptional regulator [Burkholderia sp. b13]SIT68317.1 Cd(II)/Pb(II)-responsive transcriptional regulator [Burk
MKIGELAKRAGCTPETVRFYEKEGLLPVAARTGANYRAYGEAHLDRLRFVRNCRALDMTHDEIRVLLQAADAPARDCGAIDALVDEHLRHVSMRIDELQQLRAQLSALRERCHGARSVQDCGIMRGLAAMDGPTHVSRQTHLG